MRAFLWIASAILTAALPATAQTSWRLLWSDEFDGPANSSPDPGKWTYDLGNNNGWGNQELETYTSLPVNAHRDGLGNLVIHVDSTPSGYSSARLKTQGLFAVRYGRVEARIKIPSGQGIWPAFWMLGQDITSVNWPQCGEIDIMENIGREPSMVHGSLHGPGYSGGSAITAAYVLPNGNKFSGDFHTFAVQWSPEAITFFVDGSSYQTVTSSLPGGRQWVFNKPFFLLLNVAVGGSWPGRPDATTQFPQEMLVDYVRVYEATDAPAPAVNAGGVVDAASYGPAMAPGGLASMFGTGLAQSTSGSLFDPAAGEFAESFQGTTVFVNGFPAPLIYASPLQVNFQIPWESLTETRLNVEAARDGVLSNAAPITLATAAPSAFSADGVAIVTCGQGTVRSGAACSLWGNGFGPTNSKQQTGIPSSVARPAPTTRSCALTIGGANAALDYCGAAPGLLIYQLNFTYPSGAAATGTTAQAVIAIDGATGKFAVPAAH